MSHFDSALATLIGKFAHYVNFPFQLLLPIASISGFFTNLYGQLTVAKKCVLVDHAVGKGCYPHKRSMVSWDRAECRVTDLSQPLT